MVPITPDGGEKSRPRSSRTIADGTVTLFCILFPDEQSFSDRLLRVYNLKIVRLQLSIYVMIMKNA